MTDPVTDPAEAADTPEGADALDALAVAAAGGDAEALNRLLTIVEPRVKRTCGRILLYPQDAEEAAQDALLLVATKIDQFQGRSRFTTWLHVVATNSARGTYRSLKRRSVEQSTDEMPLHVDPRTTSVIAGSRLDLLEALEVVGHDHPEYVEPLVLRDVHQLDYAEIARVLDLPLGTVKARIHHARRAVRPLLAVVD
ncbi:RNA polymerase sigma factor [Nocardioides sp.]|uniref:RNA polymerase sigma factor n=1 Tax=Nocardioides sp. TaxID=35761 RepID=UPI002724EEC9|nr:RNA polymerase sigma factor [Nocardioides sp.]MDO9457099.1 RNA polymerase sigma factor [Nocardioides sp.]